MSGKLDFAQSILPVTDSPAPRPHLRRRTAILVITACVAVLLLWTLGTPAGLDGKAVAVGYAICHRIAERSFHIEGVPMPLCARCTGIYLGVMTGLLIALARGRLRASRLPPPVVLVVFAFFALAIAVDGLNSYIQLFPDVSGVYLPHNHLRLVTGMGAGIVMAHVLLPIFNGIAWQQRDVRRSLDGIQDLAGVCLAGAVVVALVLSERPLFLSVLGLLSAAGVVFALTLIGTVFFLSVMRIDRSALTWRDLFVPLTAGFTLAILEIGAINIVRFAVTGTWDGFIIPPHL